jgi:hypothetical protein
MAERDYVKEFEAIMDGIEDSVLEASDEEILAEAREAGEDVKVSAERLRSRLLEVVNGFKRERLLIARKERARALADLEKARASLPTSHDERRTLLQAVLAQHSDVRGRLTAQYRDLTRLSDEDVESCLRHLQALGVLAT